VVVVVLVGVQQCPQAVGVRAFGDLLVLLLVLSVSSCFRVHLLGWSCVPILAAVPVHVETHLRGRGQGAVAVAADMRWDVLLFIEKSESLDRLIIYHFVY